MLKRYAALCTLLLIVLLAFSGCLEGLPDLTGGRTTTTTTTEPVGQVPDATGGQSGTKSTPSSSTASTTLTSPTKPPTVHTLTPLAATEYYGLTRLQLLGDEYVKAYYAIAQAVENYETHVPLQRTLTEAEMLKVFYYYRADYPQHFWCDSSIRYTISGNKIASVTLNFNMTKDQLPQAQAAFNKAVTELLQLAATGDNEYERELLLHDALAKRITYRSTAHAHDAYGALVEGVAVCEGYARAFQYVLYQAGIQCLIAEGSSVNPDTGRSEAHAWNVVRIDGRYYHVDLTWDDIDRADLPVMYPYFNLPTTEIQTDHSIRTEECYRLPMCTATAANYHVKNGTRLTYYDVDTVGALLRANGGKVHVYITGGSQGFVDWVGKNHGKLAKQLGLNGYRYSMQYTGNEVVLQIA